MIIRVLLLVLCLVLAATPITMIAGASPTVGVNAGEWIKWNITAIAPAKSESLTAWLQVTIQSVSGTQVSGTYVASSDNALGLPASSTDFTVDVATGLGTAIYRDISFLVPQNLSRGDDVPGTSLVVSLNSSQDDRDAAFASAFAGNISSFYYWDRLNGVLLSYNYQNSNDNSSVTMDIVDTNMWGAGVSAGDWMRWDITVASHGLSATMWLKVTIQNVSITKVTATYESNLPGQPNEPTDLAINVATGAQDTSIYSGIDRLIVVSAKLNIGDTFPQTFLKVNGTATKNGRDAAVATLLISNVTSSTYYWDRAKGVLLEYSSSSGDTTTLIKVADTNLWNTETNWSFWILVAIVVAVIIVVAYLLIRKMQSARARRSPKA